MDFENLLTFILLYAFAFWYPSYAIQRIERQIVSFYWVLREKYPHSYVRQTKPVRTLRKLFRMENTGTIHWVIGLFHYLQMIILLAPVIALLSFAFYSKSFNISCIVIVLLPFGMMCIIGPIHTAIQCYKCKRIRKTNTKYSKRRLQYEKTNKR